MLDVMFSIITVCYNAADNLRKTLASVERQTFGDYEHIIIDGSSTDSTAELLKTAADDSRRVIVSESDKGIYDAMNKGLGRAKGEYLIFMNAGDIFAGDDTLNVYTDVITEHNHPGIVYGQTLLVDTDGTIVGERHLKAPEHLTLDSFAQGMVVCHQAMAVSRRIAPLYDTRWRFSADYEWVVKCLQKSHSNVYTGQVMCHYLSEGTTTANRKASLVERFRIMSRYYGFVPTVLRHFKFALRFIRSKRIT